MGIGDYLMFLKALEGFRIEDERICWVVKPECEELIRFFFPDSPTVVLPGNTESSLGQTLRYLVKEVQQKTKPENRGFLILDYKTKPVLFFTMAARLSGSKKIAGHCTLGIVSRVFRHIGPMEAYRSLHEVDRYRDLLKLSVQAAYEPAKSYRNLLENYPLPHIAAGAHGRDAAGLIAIATGSARPFKKWSVDKFEALCRRFLADGYHILLIGGPFDRDEAAHLEAALNTSKAVNCTGQTGILGSGRLLLETNLLITNDSAMMHFADLLGTPVVGIFGITNPARCGPYSQQQNCIVAKHPMARLYAFGEFPDWTDECINELTVEDVYLQTNTVLANESLKT